MPWNDDQPRDERGRWGSGGFGGAARATSAPREKRSRAELIKAMDRIKSGPAFADRDAPRRNPEDPKDREEIDKAATIANDIAKEWQKELEPHGIKVVLGGSLISGLSLPGEEHDMDIRFLSENESRKDLIPTIEKITGLKFRKEITIGPGEGQDSKAIMIEGFIERDGIRLEAEGALREGKTYEGWAKHYKDVLTPEELSIARAMKAELASTETGRKSKEYKAYKNELLKEVMSRVQAKRSAEANKASSKAKESGKPADHTKAAEAHREAASVIGQAAKTSEDLYKTGDTWAKERLPLHEEYTKSATRDVPKSAQQTVYMTGGGPASGKTTGLLNNPATKIPGAAKAAHLNPDDAKAQLPEFQSMVKAGDTGAANHVHEESSHMVKEATTSAIDGGLDVVLDTVGDSGIKKLSQKVSDMRASGAKRVVAHYATLDVEEAVKRNITREKKAIENFKNGKGPPPRKVPEAYLRMVHHDVAKTSVAAIESGIFDEMDVFDTSGDSPVHIASFKKETGLKILDEAAWQRHKDRGK